MSDSDDTDDSGGGDTDTGAGLDLGAPEQPNTAEPYVVLARKYRPDGFDDLIGQDAMVQTLRNAFATDRIAQGFMLTGVRGTGKTTTARILARALNYERADGSIDAPTVDFDGYGVHCADIIKSRHADVLEMDAASNTGVDNIREIIESARYRPLVARYKVFIIDEVHMLSKGAFNALLKTLEEPPGHVKFIFATTEVRKVPVTVLSRCQRFDLRRVDVETLVPHFEKIVTSENATAETEALALIARAAEGSVRDGLSILDQAIAMGSGAVTADGVRAMIGLADRGRIFDLLVAAMSGTPKAMLETFDALYRDGAEPLQLLADLADAVHVITKAKAAGTDALGEDVSGSERTRAGELAETLSMGVLARAWQLLQRGGIDAQTAANPKAAAEMVLIRLAYASEMPPPDQLIRALGGVSVVAASSSSSGTNGTDGATASARQTATSQVNTTPRSSGAGRGGSPGARATATDPAPQTQAVAQTGPNLQSFQDVIAFVGTHRDPRLRMHLEDHVSLVAFEPGRIELALLEGAPRNLAGELGEKLTKWAGERWIVAVSRTKGAEPVGVVRRRAEAAALADLKSHPAVEALMAGLPNASIVSVRDVQLETRDNTAEGTQDGAADTSNDDDAPGENNETTE